MRDLVRAREAAKGDHLRARHRLQKFLLRHGRRPPEKIKPWTERHLEWVRREVQFEALAQQAVLTDYLAEVCSLPHYSEVGLHTGQREGFRGFTLWFVKTGAALARSAA